MRIPISLPFKADVGDLCKSIVEIQDCSCSMGSVPVALFQCFISMYDQRSMAISGCGVGSIVIISSRYNQRAEIKAAKLVPRSTKAYWSINRLCRPNINAL